MTYARRTDATQATIVRALREIGVQVIVLSRMGDGVPDLLTWSPDRGWLPIELKTPTGKLTPAQSAQRLRTPYPVVRSVGEALGLFGVIT